jgi:putative phosphoribosyl transferase
MDALPLTGVVVKDDEIQLPYINRLHAGQLLARELRNLRGAADIVVVGLPRGGVPVAYEVATALWAPLDVMLVRKIGAPGHEELAIGAVASGSVRVLNEEIIRGLHLSPQSVQAAVRRAMEQLASQERQYRGGLGEPVLAGRYVVLVDDGLATGASMRAAIVAVRARRPARVMVAVPVAPPDAVRALSADVDEIICPATPEPFNSVGQWYHDFTPVTDEEIRQLMDKARRARDSHAA